MDLDSKEVKKEVKESAELIQVYLSIIRESSFVEINGFKWPINNLITAISNKSELGKFRGENEDLKDRLAEKEKEIGNLMQYLNDIKHVLALIQNRPHYNCELDDERFFSKENKPMGIDVKGILQLHKDKKELKLQLAEKEKRIKELEEFKNSLENILVDESHGMIGPSIGEPVEWAKFLLIHVKCIVERSKKLSEKEAKLIIIEEVIERAVVALDQTKKFFKSKKIAQIRFELIAMLSQERVEKLQKMGIVGGKVESPVSWPWPGPFLGYEDNSRYYSRDKLDTSNPPKGGSGVK